MLLGVVGGVVVWGGVLLITLISGGRSFSVSLNGMATPPPGEDLAVEIDYTWSFLLESLCIMVSITTLLMLMLFNYTLASVPGMTTGRPSRAVLRQARRGAVVTALLVSAFFALTLIGLAVLFDSTPFGIGTMSVIAVTLGLLSYSRSAFAAYFRVRRRLAATGNLPWRLTAFLEDAHRLGILRQSGTVYQFRHARLRDYLVTRTGKTRLEHEGRSESSIR